MHTTRTPGRERLMNLGHYLAAFVLAMKAVSYVDHQPVPWPFVTLCVVSAAAITVITGFHHRIEARFPRVQAVVHLAEAVVCAVLAYAAHGEGKTGLPWAWALAAVVFFGRGVWELTRSVRPAHSA